MNSWQGYSKQFLDEMRTLKLSSFEKCLIASLSLLCLFNVVDSLVGHDPGNYEQVKMAKIQAQQEMMASRINQLP